MVLGEHGGKTTLSLDGSRGVDAQRRSNRKRGSGQGREQCGICPDTLGRAMDGGIRPACPDRRRPRLKRIVRAVAHARGRQPRAGRGTAGERATSGQRRTATGTDSNSRSAGDGRQRSFLHPRFRFDWENSGDTIEIEMLESGRFQLDGEPLVSGAVRLAANGNRYQVPAPRGRQLDNGIRPSRAGYRHTRHKWRISAYPAPRRDGGVLLDGERLLQAVKCGRSPAAAAIASG